MKTIEQEGFDLPSWRFRISRLGPVESGEIEVKPLTLLCGPNYTGKTWVMYAIYGFLSQASSPSKVFSGINDVIRSGKNHDPYSWDFSAWIEENFKEILDSINSKAKTVLSEIFDAPNDLFNDSAIELLETRERLVESAIRCDIDFNIKTTKSSETAFYFKKPKNTTTAQVVTYNLGVPGIDIYLAGVILRSILKLKGSQVFLIPAERSGLHLFFRELADYRADVLHPQNIEKLLNNPDEFNISHYAKPIADYINWLNKMRGANRRKSNNKFKIFSKNIERLAGGSYEVNADGDISFVVYASSTISDSASQSQKKFDLHLASSTAKSLLGLWFYLEHQAKPGDVLMIDEPELNLHPANQRAVARLLARLVNAGIRVVCSTHSDYFVREINSLLMLSRPHPKRDDLMKKFGYDEEEILKPEQVGAYVFDKGRIDAMPITADEGIIAKTFDEQIHELNETSDDIYYTYRGDYDEGEA